jgi:hypothetical protein
MRRLLFLLALLGFLIPWVLGRYASLPPGEYFLSDQRVYAEMAASPAGTIREPPFCWRPLLPALVRATPLAIDSGFHLWMLVALALLPPLMALFVRAAGASVDSAITAGVLMAVSPATVGSLSWDYVRPEALSLLLILASGVSLLTRRPVAFLVCLVALSLEKETWIVAAVFAVCWTWACDRSLRRVVLVGAFAALAVAAAVRLAIPPATEYSILSLIAAAYWPLDPLNIARRAMLATGSTWNVLAPLAALAIGRRARDPVAWALAVSIAVATAQILVAIDVQRIVTAAYPFVLLACTWELDRLPPRARRLAAATLIVAQVPWLLKFARTIPLVLRGPEIALALATVAALLIGLRLSLNAPIPAARPPLYRN